MRVVTFNARHGARDGIGWRSHVTDGRGLRASFAALDADVLALQEVDRRVVRSWFRDQVAVAAATARRGRPGPARGLFAPARKVLVSGADGVGLVVRGQVHSSRTLPLPGSGPPRVALFARVTTTEGTTATVVSTHLQNRIADRPSEAPGQLDALLTELASWPEPWIVAGDLNLRPDVAVPLLERAGLTPCRGGPTRPAHRARIEIDWLAVRGLRPAPDRPPVAALRMPVSDHLALVAHLEPAPDPARSVTAPEPGRVSS